MDRELMMQVARWWNVVAVVVAVAVAAPCSAVVSDALTRTGGTGSERKHDKKHEKSGAGESGERYQMREKLVSFGDDFWIENEEGEKVFKFDGKMLRVRDTIVFEDTEGNVLVKIQERVARVKDSIAIEGPDGKKLAEVKQAIVNPVRDRWTVKVGDGPDLDVTGNIVDHEYTIGEGHDKVAEVSKKWFRVADSYGVEIVPGQNDILILAVTVAIDEMAH